MRIVKVLLLTLLLVSCSSKSAKKTSLKSNSFNDYLATRYLAYSQYKSEQNDSRNSNYFSSKGLKASRNKETHPELPEKWKSKFLLQSVDFDEFDQGRERLINVLNFNKAKTTFPMETASLQFYYDCWICEESAYIRFDKISKCRTKFFVLLEYMEEELTLGKYKAVAKKKEEPDYLISKTYHKDSVEYNVYFDFNNYKLNRNAQITIKKILSYLSTMEGNYKITLEGHADRSGKVLYNESLARKRVLSVKNSLIKNGVPKDVMTSMTSSGEANPKIITRDRKREQLNRRVTVKIEELNEDDFSYEPLPLDY